jgi:hypothetical protein
MRIPEEALARDEKAEHSVDDPDGALTVPYTDLELYIKAVTNAKQIAPTLRATLSSPLTWANAAGTMITSPSPNALFEMDPDYQQFVKNKVRVTLMNDKAQGRFTPAGFARALHSARYYSWFFEDFKIKAPEKLPGTSTAWRPTEDTPMLPVRSIFDDDEEIDEQPPD